MTSVQAHRFTEAIMAPQDDIMEASDEFKRQIPLDEEIEIDFDIGEDLHEDENMLEGGYSDEEHLMQEYQYVQFDNDDEMVDEEGSINLTEDIFDEDIEDVTGEHYSEDQGEETLLYDQDTKDASIKPDPSEVLRHTPAGSLGNRYVVNEPGSTLDVSREEPERTETSERQETDELKDISELHEKTFYGDLAQDLNQADHESLAQTHKASEQDQYELEERGDSYSEDSDDGDEHTSFQDLASEHSEQMAPIPPPESDTSPRVAQSRISSSQENLPGDLQAASHYPDSNVIDGSAALTGETSQDAGYIAQQVDKPSFSTEVNDQHHHTHPVLVHYQDDDICLFPPRIGDQQSETYFLQDETLVNENLISILEACRSVLAESISDREELVMNIETLDLIVSETAEATISTTLSQIINLYLQLHRNDGVQDPEPLRLVLTTRPKFVSQLDYLYAVANEGKGFLDISLTELPNPESLPDTIVTVKRTDDSSGTVKNDDLAEHVEDSVSFVKGSTTEQIHDGSEVLESGQLEHDDHDFVLDFGSPTRSHKPPVPEPSMIESSDTNSRITGLGDYKHGDREHGYENEESANHPEDKVQGYAEKQTLSGHENDDLNIRKELVSDSNQYASITTHPELEPDAKEDRSAESPRSIGGLSHEIFPMSNEEAGMEADDSHDPMINANQRSIPESHDHESSSFDQLDYTNEDVLEFEDEDFVTTDVASVSALPSNLVDDRQDDRGEGEVKQSHQNTVKEETDTVSGTSGGAVEDYIEDEINYDDEDEEENDPEPGNSHDFGQSSTGEPNLSLDSLKRPRTTEDEATDIIDYEPHEDKKSRSV